jgi:serine/threonine protein kinase
MSAQEETLQAGQILESRYRIISEGMPQDIGTQYKAYDMQLDRLAAVLVLDRRFGTGAESRERLSGVQQALTDLTEPALLSTEQIDAVDGRLCLVRNHVEGRALADLLQRAGSLKTRAALEIVVRLCDALGPAHRAGLVHGGLSPHCVFVEDDGRVTVTDTGLIPALRPDPVTPGQPWGRLPYVSPEQAAGEEIHPASDVYTIGLLMYEMLAGRPPFRAGDDTVLLLQHLRYDPPSLQVLVPDVPLPLAQIVHKALAKEPAARYRNAGQLAHILRSQLGLQTPTMPPEAVEPRRGETREQLVVSAPPLPAPAHSTQGTYELSLEAGYRTEESAGVDWLMVGLLIAALIAVLGLIPLWRSVYRRYATPPLAPTPTSYRLTETEADSLLPYRTQRGGSLRAHGSNGPGPDGRLELVRGQLAGPGRSLDLLMADLMDGAGRNGERMATGLWVWESRLRS